MSRCILCLFAILLTACHASDKEVEMLRVKRGEFVISLNAQGELRAAESTPVRPPKGSQNPRTISWLAPNHSAVKKGDLIARFDVSEAEQGALQSGIELDKVDIDVMAKERELERLLSQLDGELDIVEVEKRLAAEFTIEDSLAYSRHEIIDATRDKALLDYRAKYLQGKKSNYSQRESAELEVLDAIRAAQEIENRQYRQQIDQSEVRAPHDGFLIYEKYWWGDPIDVGSSIFPGNKFASIPNLEKMEAVLHVPETEAVGLSPGQSVDVIIEAFPDRPLTGTITSVSATAAPIIPDDPVKFFSAVVALDKSDADWITPEAQVIAVIHINRIKDTIAVPNQVLFQDDSGYWVLVGNDRSLKRRDVKLGVRGANRSEVISGLEAGEEIALYPPEGWKL